MTHAFIFPGQGSQTVGMLADLAPIYPIVRRTFEEASDVLGYDLWQLTQAGPKKNLDKTDKTQPALLASSVALWRIWQKGGGTPPQIMAGHSFGEYSALVCAGAVEFTEAIRLAQDRGRFMQTAVPAGVGAMAAILGLTSEQIDAICTAVAQDQIVSAVNFNTPIQTVIAGHKTAVERAMEQAKTAGAKRTVLLPVSVPAHCALMQPAAQNMAKRLTEVHFKRPMIPVIHNVDVSTKETPEAIRAALSQQLYSPVRWVETIQQMAAKGMVTLFECGPGKVLSGLTKQINRRITPLTLQDAPSLEKALDRLETQACTLI
jgi:[acyl-carrier-protein] S-malonyltransferase